MQPDAGHAEMQVLENRVQIIHSRQSTTSFGILQAQNQRNPRTETGAKGESNPNKKKGTESSKSNDHQTTLRKSRIRTNYNYQLT
jgi:hypothetical protein